MLICLITRNRLSLLKQTLTTMVGGTMEDHILSVVVDQPSDPAVIEYLTTFDPHWPYKVHINSEPKGVGGSRNEAVKLQGFDERTIVFADDDLYFLEGWDATLNIALGHPGVAVVGGFQHPYHHPSKVISWMGGLELRCVDATAGYLMAMRRRIWDIYGPFDSTSIGPGKSEDWSFCQRAIADHRLAAYIHPPVVLHCGLTNCEGNPCTGSTELHSMNEQWIRKLHLQHVLMI